MPIKKVFGIDPEKRIDVPDGLRGSGVTGGKGIFDEYFNQILFELSADHIINTESAVKAVSPVEGTTYFNSTAGEFQDKNDVATVFTNGQKIVWAGLDAITATVDLSAFDNITHDYIEGVTIDFGSQDILLGSNQIGFLNCASTGDLSATDSPELVINNNRTEKLTDFETSKDLVINVQSNTTSDLDASFIRLLDNFNNALLIEDVDETFDITTDLNAGVEKPSNQYQKWIGVDYLGHIQRILAPDIESVTNGTTSGFLVDSTNVAFADKVQVGDIIFNLSTLLQTTVKTTPTVDNANIEVNDDIFTSGDDYKIRILSPQFDSGKVFKGRIGAAFNNSGGNFDIAITWKSDGIPYIDPDAIGANPTAEIYPNGDIIGITDNGSYTKFVNGDLICNRLSSFVIAINNAEGSIFLSGIEDMDYPIEFASIPKVTPIRKGVGNYWTMDHQANNSILKCSIRLVSAVNTLSGSVGYKAIGRWK